MASTSENGRSYRADIDGLRAIAVMAVVAFHASPRWLPGGFTGVDIFFVISGFLISTIISDELVGGTFRYRDFYARRIRRLFPALIVVMTATIGLGWWMLLGDEFRALGRQVLSSTLFVANFSFWKEAGYFDTAVESKPLLHLWSLAVEEQFYLIWPAWLALAWRRGRILRWILGVALVSFLIGVAWRNRYPDAAFYLPFGRFWELAAGAAVGALVRADVPARLSAAVRNAMSIVGLLCIGAGLAFIDRHRAFPGWWALLPVTGACLCIGAGPQAWVNRRALSLKWMVGIGLISYPLYLWHWPLLAYARVLQEGFGDPPRLWRFGAVGIAVFLAWLTYRFVERPIRHRPGRRVLMALALGMVLLGLAGASMLRGLMPPRSHDPNIQAIIAAGSDWVFPDEMQSFSANGFSFETVPGNRQQVVLIGDSHVEQYRARALQLARQSPDRLATLLFATRGACPPIPRFMEPRDPLCEERRQAGFALAQRPEVTAVVLAGCWACYFDIGDATSQPTSSAPPPPDRFYYVDEQGAHHYLRGGDGVKRSLQALGDVIRELRAAGKRVYLVLNIPVGGDYEPRVRLAVRRGNDLQVPLMAARPDDRAVGRKIAMGRLRSLAVLPVSMTVPLSASQLKLHEQLKQIALDNGAIALDPMTVLCRQDDQCERTDAQGGPIYKDGTHLRAAYVRDHATFLDRALLVPDGEAR